MPNIPNNRNFEMQFHRLFRQETLFKSLILARRKFGAHTIILSDEESNTLTYEDLITRSFALGRKLNNLCHVRAHIGLLLPTTSAAVVSFFALMAYARIPTMLNFSAGSAAVVSACHTTCVHQVISSKRFIDSAKLHSLIDSLSAQGVQIIYLEELAKNLSWFDKFVAKFKSKLASYLYNRTKQTILPSEEAVTMFTSGSEGTPKGVALSHLNIQANRAQALAVLSLQRADILLNVLPLFHSFGLTALLLALFSGIKTVLYPSPLHYQKIPKLIEQSLATVFFATDTFLQGYGHYAKPSELNRLRLVFAGAEKLKESTRENWLNKFSIQILEGYGTTETSPILSLNTPNAHKAKTVGRLLPSIEFTLTPIPGVAGGQLKVKGPNIMLGYYQADKPGQLISAQNEHDTGDIVTIDEEGFINIIGRAKRFAKIAGEMISLQSVEQLIHELWPAAQHAVLSCTHPRHGETLILITNHETAEREHILKYAKHHGVSELMCPKKIIVLADLPLLASGKMNYAALGALLNEDISSL